MVCTEKTKINALKSLYVSKNAYISSTIYNPIVFPDMSCPRDACVTTGYNATQQPRRIGSGVPTTV